MGMVPSSKATGPDSSCRSSDFAGPSDSKRPFWQSPTQSDILRVPRHGFQIDAGEGRKPQNDETPPHQRGFGGAQGRI